ncbi:sigma 54-interacting transcriptional regulator [Pendulispora albinea]|uniref:Sigma 54-interacting transcriptional regulator n=1 Tax=Pendulispora albinea TaxID=2741071 RepID=A0ABZ2LJE2_9BACT
MSDDQTIEYQGAATELFSTAYVRVAGGTDPPVKLESSLVVGSGTGAALTIADPLVSRVHAQLELGEDGVWVRDLGSRNGTFVEGVRVGFARVPSGGAVVVGHTRIAIEVDRETRPLWPTDRFGPLLGGSVKMREVFHRLLRVANSDAVALIHGETGTGKELVARAIHEASVRAKRPFVVVDCGAMPGNLLESELFGHAKGAFTGAVSTHLGAVEVAAEGTIFLDEVGELPLDVQPKLLRALESHTFRRIGETNYRPIRARFLTATHRNLAAMVNEGTFREDLFFRLNVLPIAIPPLRDRRDDIPLIVAEMLRARGAPPLDLPMTELSARSWPGNVRELRSFIERAVTLGAEEALAISPATRPETKVPAEHSGGAFPPVDVSRPFKDIRDEWIDHLERTYVTSALSYHGGNVTAVAEAAGLARSYVHRLIRKHGLDR